MKYVIAWETRDNFSEETQERGLKVFSNWQPDENLNFQQFLGRLDARGGFAGVETDDPTAITKEMATFGAFFEFNVYPVLDIQEAATLAGQAIAFRNSIL